MRPPLYLDVTLRGAAATVSLARCRNCGQVKAMTNPCSLDHLAAVMEFKRDYPDATPPTPERAGRGRGDE